MCVTWYQSNKKITNEQKSIKQVLKKKTGETNKALYRVVMFFFFFLFTNTVYIYIYA